MRLLFASLIIALFMVSSFSSCQKEVEGNLPVLIQSDSSFIDKIIALDTTLPAGADTTEKMFLAMIMQKIKQEYPAIQDRIYCLLGNRLFICW